MSYRFFGRERVTLELDGTFDPARLALPAALDLELVEGRARVRLFAFHVEDLRIQGVPLVRASYPEVLWWIAARDRGEPVWWVAACDLAHRGARFAAARWVRYPVRALAVEVEATRLAAKGELGELAIGIGPAGAEIAEIEQRSLRVGAGDLAVPWGDDETPAHPATARIEADSLSMATVGAAVAWAPVAIVRHGRQHRCGVARPA